MLNTKTQNDRFGIRTSSTVVDGQVLSF